jgi:hypothetical protein
MLARIARIHPACSGVNGEPGSSGSRKESGTGWVAGRRELRLLAISPFSMSMPRGERRWAELETRARVRFEARRKGAHGGKVGLGWDKNANGSTKGQRMI